ncbi:MAG: nucleotidyl transferase AbiEii/AbiGii toxin family protein [Bryobacterales bacterium]|nr:nucleotidyl transferase AbiEii/AbiGii toxin family protein [Bryobacterales bacterium]
MNFEQVRRLTIAALFSDDELVDQLVLKGGNAMSLIHRISPRLSLDLDFSLEADFEDIEGTRKRMEDALASRFESVQLVPFDVQLEAKPSSGRPDQPWWGGYELKFKLLDDQLYRSYGSDRRRMQREAAVLGPGQQRVFSVDFSKHEYTAGKIRVELDHYTIYVYSPAMIALEKIRAICQQMAEYEPTGKTKRARARDFFDIHAVVTKTGFSFGSPASLEMAPLIFAAKEVPLHLLG